MWRVLHIDVHACLLALFDVNVCMSIIDKYVVVALFQWVEKKSNREREQFVAYVFPFASLEMQKQIIQLDLYWWYACMHSSLSSDGCEYSPWRVVDQMFLI